MKLFCIPILSLILGMVQISAQVYTGEFIESNGVKIHYLDKGEGEPVILSHGYSQDLHMWIQPGVLDSLVNNNFRVIAYDARGHGQSDKPHDPEQYGKNDITDVIALMDQLAITKAHIVGYSRGASIANAVRAMYPARCKTVVLGGYGLTENGNSLIRNLDIMTIADSIDAGNARPLIRELSPPGVVWTEEQLQGINAMMMAQNDQHALAAAFRAGLNHSVSDKEYRSNTVPTLALIGTGDTMLEDARAMKPLLNKLHMVEIPGTDHFSALAFPFFTKELIRFLSEN